MKTKSDKKQTNDTYFLLRITIIHLQKKKCRKKKCRKRKEKKSENTKQENKANSSEVVKLKFFG